MLRVVWLCHFSSSEIQSILRPWRVGAQFAPWISYTLKAFENCDSAELHVVSPHEYIPALREFVHNGVFYHFYNPFVPLLGRHWPGFFRLDKWTNFAGNKRVVARLIERIAPDIIHLQGAENPYYSSTALQFMDKLPLVVNLQRINTEFIQGAGQRASIEKAILSRAQYFSIRTKTMERDFMAFRPDARVFWVKYAMPQYRPIIAIKEYEVVFFAQVGKEKGIEDLLQAFSLIRKRIEDAKLCVIGSVTESYKTRLLALTQELDIIDGVTWKGRLPNLSDVHLEASKAKVSVLPTYNDIISGTIIESMQLGLPVVSYKTGSIPELNEDRENVLLSERGDVEGLAKNILKLLTDQELYNTMSQRGIDCIKQRYSNLNVLKQHLDCYGEVIADFHNSKIKKQATELP
jgi:glycosyltransferase involved in cell wall biosynthesis